MFRLALIIVICSICIAEETVKFAAVIYRHGDRTPVDTYPTDPYRNESLWPERFGELTNMGKMQHYKLGIWLRNRYKDILPEEFDPKELVVRSTDVDRTLMSAQANMAGMYPPHGKAIWNKQLLWQPIPIHTKPERQDEVLAMKKNCSSYNKAMEQIIHSEPYKNRLSKYQHLMNYLTAYSGKKIKDYYDIMDIYNILYIESLYNFTLPDWTKAVYPDKLYEPACYSFTTSAATPLLARLRAGPLLKDIVTKMKHAISEEQNRLKLAIYSGHDFTIGTLLTALNMFDGNCPVYTATIFIELISDVDKSSSNFIRISYRNSTEIVEPHVLEIPYCGTRCPLERFTKLYENLLTVNFDEECGNHQFPSFICISMMLVAVMMVLVFAVVKTRNTGIQHGSHHAYTTCNSSGKVVFLQTL